MVRGLRSLKKILCIVSVAFVLCVSGCAGKKEDSGTSKGARLKVALLRDAKGDVEIQRHGKPSWIHVRNVMFLFPQDSVRTKENSEAHIVFVEGYHVKIGPLSEVQIRVPRKPLASELPGANPVSDVKEIVGRLYGKVRKNSGAHFEVATPTAVAGIRGTSFSVKVEQDGNTLVSVSEGAVELKPAPPVEQSGNTGGQPLQGEQPVQFLIVSAGQQATVDMQMVRTGAVPTQPVPMSPDEQKLWGEAMQWVEQVKVQLQEAMPEEMKGQPPADPTEGMSQEEKQEWEMMQKEFEQEQQKLLQNLQNQGQNEGGNSAPQTAPSGQQLPQQPQLSDEQMKELQQEADKLLKQNPQLQQHPQTEPAPEGQLLPEESEQ